mgnify:CR=1 FL=1
MCGGRKELDMSHNALNTMCDRRDAVAVIERMARRYARGLQADAMEV